MIYGMGMKAAAYKKGRQSAVDMAREFTKGYSVGSGGLSDVNGLLKELRDVNREMLEAVKRGSKYELYIDGKPLASRIRQITNVKELRGEWGKG